MIETHGNPQLDEAAWKAWLKKNEAQDKFRFARRMRLMSLVGLLFVLVALLWRLTD